MKSILSVLFLTFISCGPDSSTKGQIYKKSSLDIYDYADSIVENTMDQYKIPGISLGIVKEGMLIYSRGYGVKSRNSNQEVTENSLFHAASISKLFTAQAVMMLVSEGKMSLEDRLIDLIPDITYSDERVNQITIKMMLNHTSGIRDVRDYKWETQDSSKTALRYYVMSLDLSLKFDPGTEYAYSNMAYDILGYIVEKKAYLSFDEFQKQKILNPAGMEFSDFRYFQILDSLKTSPHSRKKIFSKVYVRKVYPHNRAHAPSSTLNTSGKELSYWMLWFMNELKMSDENLWFQQMIEPTFEENVGLGFQLFDLEGMKAVGHFGGDQGFRSLLIMVPQKMSGVVVLGNADFEEQYRTDIVRPLLRRLIQK
jgi:CubicO group peptidase (beta-lactamase class C family)